MKNKLLFSYLIINLTLHNTLKTQNIQDPLTFEDMQLSTDLFNNILDNCSLPETSCHLSPLRNANEVIQNENILQKIRIILIRCYANMLCRYYKTQQWLSRHNKNNTSSRA
jgi:hypothetical protein